MSDRWDVKCREVYVDNSQKYQIWLNGVVVGEVVNRFDAVEKLRNVFERVEALQQENVQLIQSNRTSQEIACIEIDRLQEKLRKQKKENEQIWAQVKLARELLEKIQKVKGYTESYFGMQIQDVLAEIDKIGGSQ